MLGAQARRAEYNAARNASARQASREAEDQTLPPKPAPISLSAFTRATQTTRNKGTKSFVPLVLEETGEEDETPSEEHITPTPTRSILKSGMIPSNPNSDGSVSSGNIRINIPQHAIPVAPRAMMHHGPPPPLPMPYPPRPAQQFIIDNHGQVLFPGMVPGGTPSRHVPGWAPGVYIQSAYLRDYGLPMLDPPAQAVDVTPEGMNQYGNMMVPTDLTPTKQEQKLDMLAHQPYPNPLYGYDEARYAMLPQAASLPVERAMSPPRGIDPARDIPRRILQRQQAARHESEIEAVPQTVVFAPQAPPGLLRHQSFPNAVTEPSTKSSSRIEIVRPDRPATPKMVESDEPYDRASKMQRFVEEQQAMARSGKTVLNSSSAGKESDEKQDENKPQKQKARSKMDEVRAQHEWYLANDRYRKQPDPSMLDVPTEPPDVEVGTAIGGRAARRKEKEDLEQMEDDVGWRDFFGVGNDDWFDLKAPTRLDRDKMQFALGHVALKMAPALGAPLHPDQERDWENAEDWTRTDNKRFQRASQEETQRWMHADPRGFQNARQTVDEISGRWGDDMGAGGDRREGGIRGGLVRGAGHVLANLTEYLAEDKMQLDYFNRTKSAPDFAVERAGLGANFGTISYFENAKSGVVNAPNRIGRDPRCQHQAREAMSKSEDDWPAYDKFGWRKI